MEELMPREKQGRLKSLAVLLTDASNRMHASLNIASIMRVAVSSAMQLVHAKAATSGLLIDNSLAFSEFNNGLTWQPLQCELALEEEWVGELVNNRTSSVISGLDEMRIFDLGMGKELPVSDHLIAVPVIGKEDDLLACLFISAADGALFDKQDRELLESLASMMSVAMENSIQLEESRRIEVDLEKSVATYRTLVEQIPAITYIATLDRSRILFVSPQIEAILGFCQDDFLANQEIWSQQIHADDRDRVLEEVRQSLEDNIPFHSEYRICSKHGEYLWVKDAASKVIDHEQALYLQGVVYDISERKASEEKLLMMAHHDQLTGLANRVLFHDRLDQVVAHSKRHKQKFAVLYLDLDGFKAVNDDLGHEAGDKLLVEAAHRLKSHVREVDTVARMGGDEFVMLLTDVDGMDGASSVARKVLQLMNKPIRLLTHEIIITPSIGITLAPDDSLNADILLKNADMAMYRAKSSGRNNYQFFTEEMNSKVQRHLSIENELRQAIEKNQLLLEFQPQVSIDTGELMGAETLVRWQHPEQGLIYPDDFIPIAEETGLILALGEWVLLNACREWRLMEAGGMPALKLAVNLSARQFRDQNLIEMIQNVLAKTGFKPIQLELEITETMLVEHVDHAIKVLKQLKALGISISIDDFGTGYSSLSYLKRLPIDSLKVDRSFITDIPDDKDDMEISAAVIAMAHKLKLQVVAEGVETDAQWDFLKKNKCDIGQGYLFSKSLSAQDFINRYLLDSK